MNSFLLLSPSIERIVVLKKDFDKVSIPACVVELKVYSF